MERSTYAGIPHKFEAGTPPIVEAVGLGAAVDYLTEIGLDNIHRHEQTVTGYLLDGLATIEGVSVLGPLDPTQRGGAVSFEVDGVHPHDVAQTLDARGIAVRAGHHCAKPAHKRFGVQSSTRASSYLYTTPARDRRPGRGNQLHPELLQGEVMDLDSLYQEIILDHYRSPHHAGLREPFEAEVHHVNPTCGDEITLRVHLDGDVVTDVSYDAEGCSISQAAASVMTDLVIGQPVDKALRRPRGVPRADAGARPGRARRRGARGRHRVRGRRQVPGTHQVRSAFLDGVQGRHRPGLTKEES